MIKEIMTQHHRECDQGLSVVEEYLEGSKFRPALEAFLTWKEMNFEHFSTEEELLFPRTESIMGRIPPIQVMLMEHQQIRGLFHDIEDAIKNGDKNRAIGIIETCMIMIQQHNMKEEQILYPIIERSLANSEDIIVKELKNRIHE